MLVAALVIGRIVHDKDHRLAGVQRGEDREQAVLDPGIELRCVHGVVHASARADSDIRVVALNGDDRNACVAYAWHCRGSAADGPSVQ